MDPLAATIPKGYKVDPLRGTGRTTALLQNAPKGAYFVWCADHLDYPIRLAKHLGRKDLNIVPLYFLRENDGNRLLGIPQDHIIVDHAA